MSKSITFNSEDEIFDYVSDIYDDYISEILPLEDGEISIGDLKDKVIVTLSGTETANVLDPRSVELYETKYELKKFLESLGFSDVQLTAGEIDMDTDWWSYPIELKFVINFI